MRAARAYAFSCPAGYAQERGDLDCPAAAPYSYSLIDKYEPSPSASPLGPGHNKSAALCAEAARAATGPRGATSRRCLLPRPRVHTRIDRMPISPTMNRDFCSAIRLALPGITRVVFIEFYAQGWAQVLY